METAFGNIKTDFASLLGALPTILKTNGDYVHLGGECDSTPFCLARTRVGGRDCWLFCDTAEESKAFLMECSNTTDGYVDGFREFLEENYDISLDDDIWVNDKVKHE